MAKSLGVVFMLVGSALQISASLLRRSAQPADQLLFSQFQFVDTQCLNSICAFVPAGSARSKRDVDVVEDLPLESRDSPSRSENNGLQQDVGQFEDSRSGANSQHNRASYLRQNWRGNKKGGSSNSSGNNGNSGINSNGNRFRSNRNNGRRRVYGSSGSSNGNNQASSNSGSARNNNNNYNNKRGLYDRYVNLGTTYSRSSYTRYSRSRRDKYIKQNSYSRQNQNTYTVKKHVHTRTINNIKVPKTVVHVEKNNLLTVVHHKYPKQINVRVDRYRTIVKPVKATEIVRNYYRQDKYVTEPTKYVQRQKHERLKTIWQPVEDSGVVSNRVGRKRSYGNGRSPSAAAEQQPSLSAEKMEQLRNLASNTRQTVTGYMAASSSGWTPVKEDDGIRAFSRKSPDFAGKIFKVEVDSLPGTPEQIFDHAYPTANAQRLKWDTSLKENKVVKTIEPNSIEVLYTQTAPVRIGFVEAVSSRDFCDIVSIEKTSDRISTASQSVPMCSAVVSERSSVVRGHNYANGLTLERIEGKPNETGAVQLLHTDIKGSLPTWVVESALLGHETEFFKTVRKQLIAANNLTPPTNR